MNHSALEAPDEPASPPDILHQLCICGDTTTAHTFIHHVRQKEEEFEWSCDIVKLSELRYLTLSDLHLRKTDYFDALLHLRYLNVSFNNVNDITSFAALTHLEVLDVSHNKIIDLSPIRELRSLKLLRCHANAIESIEPINELLKMEELWINENKVVWSDVIHLQPLTNLRRLVIAANPCEEKSKFYDFLLCLSPLLTMLNGVKVTSSENEIRFQDKCISSDFLKTNDGRIMLNQSRANLTNQQRTLHSTLVASVASPAKPDPLGTSRSLPESRTLQNSDSSSPKKEVTQKIVKYRAKKFQHLRIDENAATLDPTDAQIVRFGTKTSAPIAMCVDAAGCGYTRWSESGSIACSYDRDRLFCSHNNGAIAAIYDTHQNGSVMDPQGRCLLGIQSNGVAVERGVTGNIVQTYRKDTEETGESRWLFDGVEIEFDPRKWELKIVVSNARLRCQFTNLEGGKLLEVFDAKKEKPRKEKHRAAPLVSVDEHDSVRHGVKEVLSQLDDILAGIRKK